MTTTTHDDARPDAPEGDPAPGGSSSFTPAERRRLTRTPDPRVVTAVLAFSGLVAALMQMLVDPHRPVVPRAARRRPRRHDLDHHRDPARRSRRHPDRRPPRRPVRQAPHRARPGDRDDRRVDHRRLHVGARAPDRRTRAAGHRARHHPARDQHPPRHAARRAPRRSRRPRQRHPRLRRRVGLPLSAWISVTLDWHVLFWTAALLGVVVFALVAWLVPASTLRTEGRFDLPGAIGLAIGLTGVLLAVSKGNDWGWLSGSTLASGLTGLARARAVGLLPAAGQQPAGRPAGRRPPCRAAHEPRVGGARLRALRQQRVAAAAARAARRDRRGPRPEHHGRVALPGALAASS